MQASKSSRAKARRVSSIRSRLRQELLAARGPHCQACPVSPVGTEPPRAWTEMHEILTRGRGGDPCDPENILLLCHLCHAWITTHETAARKLGLVRARSAEEHSARYRPWDVA